MQVSVNSVPFRAPCEWYLAERFGPQNDIMREFGISNRQVVIVIEKEFTFLENILARVLKAPRYLKRPLDKLNSALWELMDASRTFGEIVTIMEDCYSEDIVPANERCSLSLSRMVELNLVVINPSLAKEHPV
tara:strand:+ start:195 stop:593 length:399 start_codon:yes stop_codon:yes gene_type:complete